LRRWSERRAEFDALGIEVVAISGERVDEVADLRRAHALAFPMVADPACDSIRRWGLAQKNYAGRRPVWREMALPATVLIERDGTVRWMHVPEDFRVRQTVDEVLASCRALATSEGAVWTR
jgi:peroxiredoxin